MYSFEQTPKMHPLLRNERLFSPSWKKITFLENNCCKRRRIVLFSRCQHKPAGNQIMKTTTTAKKIDSIIITLGVGIPAALMAWLWLALGWALLTTPIQ